MDFFCLGWIPAFASIVTVTIVLFVAQFQSKIRLRMKSGQRASFSKTIEKRSTNGTAIAQAQETLDRNLETEELIALKHLYYQLHNLEIFPEVLPQARRLLLSLLKETYAKAQARPASETILGVQSFSRQALEDFQHELNNKIGNDWQQYHVRRKEGGTRELFEDKEEAIWWLKQLSPVKFVDGAWLGHIGKVTAPFGLLKTMKGAWQILSEELGDGDLEKNHVHLYNKLIQSVAPGFPTAEEIDFSHPRHQLNELSVWKAAIVQLIISIYPEEFLPEIIGFNLHFEAVSMDTLKAATELKEVGLDPYYFILHISIDNADSGHTAIALEVVCEYMDYVRRTGGDEAVQKAWKKVQAGYLLSTGLPGNAISPSRRVSVDPAKVEMNPAEKEVMRIFKAKAQVVHGIHCSSRVRIGARSVADWLDPVALESSGWQRELLDALGRSKYWIRRGDSSRSRFIQELQWNGRMFGSFTQYEYDAMKKWVDGLSFVFSATDGPDIKPNTGNEDVLSGYPDLTPSPSSELWASPKPMMMSFSYEEIPSLTIGNRPVMEKFLPVWLSHPCLLQGFISVPFRTKSTVACKIITVLRAQGGFDIEQECVGGMCEVRRPNSLGLAGIGMNLLSRHSHFISALPSLKHILQVLPSDFAVHMLHISMRPIEYKGQLIGMATAFAKMHATISKSELPLLSPTDQVTLQAIAKRELEGLHFCWQELKADERVYAECCKGYLIAEHEIKKCFQS